MTSADSALSRRTTNGNRPSTGPNSFVFHYGSLKAFGVHYLQTHYLVTPRISNMRGEGVE